jgi:multiple sugar transport system substrate-binding protein
VYAACAILAGCGHSSDRSLTIAVNAGVEGTALKLAAKEWGAARGVHIEVVELPYANLFEKEELDLTSRTGAYDVIMMDDPWFPLMSANGNLAPLRHAPDGDFLQSCTQVCKRADGEAYFALPYVGNAQLFFYRRDLFEKYSVQPPKTWDEVLSAAKLIGGKEKMFGYVMRAAAGNAAVADFMPLLWAFGGDVPGWSAQGDGAAIDALRFMLELGKYTPPGYAGFNADEVSAHLLQSSAVMSINWPAWIAAMDDPSKSKVVGKIDFSTMPGEREKGVSELGAWLIAVPAGSHHADDAFAFLDWATEPAQMKQAALRGNPPTRRSVFQDAELVAKFRAFPAQLASLETARPRPRTPRWNEIENLFGTYLSKANAGAMDPAEAIHRAAEAIREVQKGPTQ